MERSILFPALFAAAFAQAQNIDAYRYWYDDATADAVTTTVAPVSELVVNTAFPTGGMEVGYHRISIQARDTDGKWSVPRSTWFTRSATTADGYRYWLNDDPATLVAATLTPGATVDLNAALATSVTRPFNLVTIQFRESDGLFSVPFTKAFVRNTGEVDGYEYWMDEAIGDRVTNDIGPAGVVDLIADLPTGLTTGTHTFIIRFRSVHGPWSVPLTTQFTSFVGIEELPGITDLLLFPNPVTDELGLRLSTDAARTLNLHVLDISGAVVRDLSTWSVNGTTYRNWDISDLASGSYLLRMSDGTGTWSTRFVKQ